MTKAEIINQITLTTGLQKRDVAVVIESFMETVKDSLLEKRENVYLRGFGSFVVKHRAAKTARNIQKNTTIRSMRTTSRATSPPRASSSR